MGDMTYTLIKVGEGMGGGLMKNPMPDGHSTWIACVKVANVKKATKKVKSLGAKIKKDVTEVKGGGSLSRRHARPLGAEKEKEEILTRSRGPLLTSKSDAEKRGRDRR